MSAISIQIPEELDTRLQALAATTGRSKSDYILDAIHEHLDDLEDICIAEQRLADIRAGRSKTIPLEEVIQNLGLED